MTSSRRVREFTVGLTAPCSIIEILLFVTPARRANSRWERPLRSRTHLSLCPRSNSAGGGSIIIFYQGSCSPLECQKPPLVFRLSSSMRCANRSAETAGVISRSEEHTSELQSRGHLVCRLLLEKKKTKALNRK